MAARPCGYVLAMLHGRWSLVRRAATVTAVTVAASALVAGCTTAKPQSTAAWQSTTDQVLGTAISSLGTAHVVLEQEAADRLQHPYTVVALTDAVDVADRDISGYLVQQPPDRLHAPHAAVSAALQQAVSLLAEVRVAVASPGVGPAGARRLIVRVDALRKDLDRMDRTVKSSPGSVGGS